MSISNDIVNQVVALLNTGPPAGVPVAKRTYTYSFDATTLPALVVYPDRDVPEQSPSSVGVLTRRVLYVNVVSIVAAGPGERPDEVIDVIRAWIVAALAGYREQNLIHRIAESETAFELAQVDHAYCKCQVEVAIEYQTRANDLGQWA